MSIRPYWEYYKACFPFIFAFSFIMTFSLGSGWGNIFLFTLAPFLASLAFNIFRGNEYIFYYNLGITKAKLLLKTYLINLVIAIPLAILFYFLVSIGISISGT